MHPATLVLDLVLWIIVIGMPLSFAVLMIRQTLE